MKMLQINTQAPNFTLPDSSNVQHSLSDYLGKKVVLYFYPKDNTGGCSKQALNYKEMLPQIIDNNAIVIGISKDSPSSHQKFETKYDLPQLLLSDESLEVIKQYDVWHEKKLYGKPYMGVVRTTYVIDEKGVIIFANDTVKASTDACDILSIINKE